MSKRQKRKKILTSVFAGLLALLMLLPILLNALNMLV